MGNGQVLAPNRYRVTLSGSDYERLSPWEAQLTRSLAELVQEYLDDNRLATIGDIEVYLAKDDSLHTGVFGVASRMEPQAPPRRRPYDSMSVPVVAGHPDQYVHPYGSQPEPPYPQQPYQPPVAQPPYQPPVVQPPAYQPTGQQPSHHQPPYQPPQRRGYRAQLAVDGTPRALELKIGSNLVGRGSDSDLQLMDQGVSRRHCDVHLADNHCTVYDLGSTNGTSVNGHPVQSQQLQHGDVIRVGHTRLVFHEDSS
jgi:Protein of unknown function (DUF3662)/FHA domain